MLYVYTTPSSPTSRKLLGWLKDNNLTFTERPLRSHSQNNALIIRDEIQHFFTVTTTGADEIISTRSVDFELIKDRYETMSLNDLVDFAYHHPRIIKSPIMVQGDTLVVGYDQDEITRVLPSSKRI